MTLHKFQFGFVLQGFLNSTCNFAWLKIKQLEFQRSQFNRAHAWCGVQANHLRFAAVRSPKQKLQFGITCCNALGIDRASRVFKHLHKQQFCTAWFKPNLGGLCKAKGFVERGTRRKTSLSLSNTDAQHEWNQHLNFHNSRLNGCSSSDMRNIKQFIHFRDDSSKRKT